MKKILITGKNSYIGTSVEAYLGKYQGQYEVVTLDVRGGIGRGGTSAPTIPSTM